jgi:hypothetical protein
VPRDQGFVYDLSGNLTSKCDRVGTSAPFTDSFTISATSNRMTAIASRGIGYAIDAAGNRTADNCITYVYDARLDCGTVNASAPVAVSIAMTHARRGDVVLTPVARGARRWRA